MNFSGDSTWLQDMPCDNKVYQDIDSILIYFRFTFLTWLWAAQDEMGWDPHRTVLVEYLWFTRSLVGSHPKEAYGPRVSPTHPTVGTADLDECREPALTESSLIARHGHAFSLRGRCLHKIPGNRAKAAAISPSAATLDDKGAPTVENNPTF